MAPSERKPKRETFWGSALMAIVIAGGIAGVAFGWQWLDNRYFGGSLASASVTTQGLLGVGAVRHSGRSRSHSDYRLTLIDPRTGARRARRVLTSLEPQCAELHPGRIWCRTRDTLEIIDLPSLSTRRDLVALKKALPELGPGLARWDKVLRAVGDQLVVRTADKRVWLLDDEPLRATPVPDARGDIGKSVSGRWPGPGSAQVRLAVDDGDRMAVVGRGGQRSSETYLKPELVELKALPGETLDLAEFGALVAHRATLDDSSRRLLTRVGPDGAGLWTRDLGRALAPKFGVVAGDHVIAVGNFGAGVAIAFDAKTGAERWRSKF